MFVIPAQAGIHCKPTMGTRSPASAEDKLRGDDNADFHPLEWAEDPWGFLLKEERSLQIDSRLTGAVRELPLLEEGAGRGVVP